MDLLNGIGNFVFGMECLGCGRASKALDPWLCPNCREELARLAKEPRFPNSDVYCLFPMRPLTRNLIHALKYKNISGMATYLVKHSSAIQDGLIYQELSLLPRPLYFVPIPLHPARLRERGYNQAEKIADALASACGGFVWRLFRRKTFVVSQTKLSREGREWNVAGAFEKVSKKNDPVSGTVIVVDDVFTTGATTSACICTLGPEFPLPVKVCTLLYDEPATAVADYLADNQMAWDSL